MRRARHRILWLGVTRHPSAEWIARQVTEAAQHMAQMTLAEHDHMIKALAGSGYGRVLGQR